MSSLRLAVIPMTSTDLVEVNLRETLFQISNTKDFKPDLICFPENSLYLNFQKKLDPQQALTLDHPAWDQLAQAAQQNKCHLHMGGVPLREGEEVYNASVLIDPSGKKQIVYRKIHLFDVCVQGRELRESESFTAGEQGAVVEINGWRVGLSICYDLRFAEMFIQYHKQNVDLILVPSSFLVATGRSHWQTLLRARAIETQAYVAAPAQVGVHQSRVDGTLERQTWGESLVVGPWGEVLATSSNFDQPLSHDPLLCVLDKGLITKTREQIPLLSHRRLSF